MDDLLEYIRCISNLELDGVEPMFQAYEHEFLLREDVCEASDCREAFVKSAPRVYEDYLVTKKMIGE